MTHPLPIEPAARENLLRLAEAWCNATGNKLITISRYNHSDPQFFGELAKRHKKWLKMGKPDRVEEDRKGSVTIRVYDRLVKWFYATRPDGTFSNWPAGTTLDAFPELLDLKHWPCESQIKSDAA